MATATLLDGYRHTVGWLPPHCWMATATLLDGDRHIPYLRRKFFLRLDALVNAGHIWLYVLHIGGNGVVEMAVEAVGDLMQPWQNRTIVLAAELYYANVFRRKFYPVDHIMVEWIAAKGIAFPKAVQQPFREIVHHISSSTSVEYNS